MKKRTEILDTSKRTWFKLILAIVVFACLELAAIFYLNTWRNTFWNAMEQRIAGEFLMLVGYFTIAAFIAIYSNAASMYFEQKLSAIWRIKMTRAYLPFYVESIHKPGVDNPDQRISDDIRKYTLQAVPWIVGVLFNLVKFLLFLGLLLVLSEKIFGHAWILPVATVLYTLIGLGITIYMGRRLIDLSFASQKLEANYRYGLAAVRAGKNDDKHEMRFWEAVQVSLQVFKRTKHLNIWTGGFAQLSVIIPILFLAPSFFVNPLFTFGLLMQAINGIGEAQTSLAYLVDQWDRIVDFLACRRRLLVYRQSMAGNIFKRTLFL